MPTTGIVTKNQDVLMFLTGINGNDEIELAIYLCDDQLRPYKTLALKVIEDKTEEQYHRDLRQDAEKNGGFVPMLSSDPDWNPPGSVNQGKDQPRTEDSDDYTVL